MDEKVVKCGAKCKNIAKNVKNIKESENVKNQAWMKALFTVYPSLPNIVSVIDNIVLSRASSVVPFSQVYNGSSSTYMEYEKVIDMTERKNKILNIVALIREILTQLNMTDYEIVDLKYFRRMKTATIANKLSIDERSVFRRIKKVIERSSSVAISLGFDSEFIERMVKNESWIREIYLKAKNELEANRVRASKNKRVL